MTYSIGFRAPARGVLAGEVLQRLADAQAAGELYGDRGQAATRRPAQIPRRLETFAAAAVRGALAQPRALARALGEVASEPKANVWFAKTAAAWRPGGLALDRRTRMLYSASDVFVNGEAFHVTGRDARLLRRLADERRLDAQRVRSASAKARALLAQWFAAGWLHRAQRALPSVKRRR
jgi:50S ribosomal protein L16 3-hydroxylase